MPVLDRRTLLRGLGAAVALPLLDAMIPVRGAQAGAASPPRFVAFTFVNGKIPEAWRPTSTGPAHDLPTCLEPLAPVQEHVRVLTGLDGPDGHVIDGGHARELRSLLCSADLDTGTFGASLDHVLAGAIGADTAIPLLVIGTEAGAPCATTDCASTFQASWREDGRPNPLDSDPVAIFQRLFGSGAGGARLLGQHAAGASLLDAVKADAASLRARLGADDRARVDEHLDGIRDLERKLSFPDTTCGGTWTVSRPADPAEHLDQLGELAALALACDRTRVVTIVPASAGSNRFLPELASVSHHVASHTSREDAVAYQRWYVERYARLVAKLASVRQSDGSTLLDDTFVLGQGSMGDGEAHDRVDVPVLLAGNGGGRPQLSGHQVYDAGTPYAALHRAILAHYGADQPWGTLGTWALSGLGRAG